MGACDGYVTDFNSGLNDGGFNWCLYSQIFLAHQYLSLSDFASIPLPINHQHFLKPICAMVTTYRDGHQSIFMGIALAITRFVGMDMDG